MYYVLTERGSQVVEAYGRRPTNEDLKQLAIDCQATLYVIEGEHTGIEVSHLVDDAEYPFPQTWGVWIEITQRLFEYFRDCVLPLYGPNLTFAMGNPLRNDEHGMPVYRICRQVGRRYFATEGEYGLMIHENLSDPKVD